MSSKNSFKDKLIQSVKSRFVKDAFSLTVGTIIAQLIPVIASVILARLYDEADMGSFAAFSSILSIVTVLIAFKYEMAILPSKDKKEGINIVSMCIFISILVAIVLYIVLIFAHNSIADLLNINSISAFLFAIPLCSVLYEIFMCNNEWCVKNKYFKNLAVCKILNTAFIAVLSVLFGLVGLKSSGMIYGQIFGQVLIAIYVIFRFLIKDRDSLKLISPKETIREIRKQKSYPLTLFPAQLINTVAGQIPVLVITAAFGAAEVGLFSFALRILSVPMTMVANAIGDIFRQRAQSDKESSGNSWNAFIKLSIFLVISGIVIFGLIALLAPVLFKFIFGANWERAGVYARILCLGEFVNFVAMPTTGLFIVYNKKRLLLVWQIIYATLTAASIFIGCYVAKSMEAALYIYSFARVVINLIHWIFTLFIARKSRRQSLIGFSDSQVKQTETAEVNTNEEKLGDE